MAEPRQNAQFSVWNAIAHGLGHARGRTDIVGAGHHQGFRLDRRQRVAEIRVRKGVIGCRVGNRVHGGRTRLAPGDDFGPCFAEGRCEPAFDRLLEIVRRRGAREKLEPPRDARFLLLGAARNSGDQGQLVDPLGVIECNRLCDQASQREPREMGAGEPQIVHQPDQVAGQV